MLWNWANSGTRVFILDLDGTLMPSAEIDNTCFWQAVCACFGEPAEAPDLAAFANVTDTGILGEWCERELGRAPQAEEIRRIRLEFARRLEAAWQREPGHFQPLPGLVEWLRAVRQSEEAAAGIATGGWGHSARLKLRLSGLDRFELPLASADDAVARAGIMRIAAERTLGPRHAGPAFFTYIGDRDWDLRASRELGWAFVGIAAGAQAEKFKSAGADTVQADFRLR